MVKLLCSDRPSLSLAGIRMIEDVSLICRSPVGTPHGAAGGSGAGGRSIAMACCRGLLGGAAEAFPWRVGGGSTDVSLHYVSLHC